MAEIRPTSEWKKYKRYSDNKVITARLVERGNTNKKKFIEIQESRIGPFVCPHCSEVLTQADTKAFPNFFLEPTVFHAKHRPVD